MGEMYKARNLNVDKKNEDTWKRIRAFFQPYGITALEVTMMGAALGVTKGGRKPLSKSFGTGGVLRGSQEFQRFAQGLITAIAVEDAGSLKILEEKSEDIIRITEEYANGGLSEFEKIVNSSDDDDIVFKHLLKRLNQSVK
tara:strand:+ start:5854 stop:6276 length:423 start_codon:yes stop_codon:yes gene_type:complete